MGNSPGSQSLSLYLPTLHLRKGKRTTGCPCPFITGVFNWDILFQQSEFRNYFLRNLSNDQFLTAIIDHGQSDSGTLSYNLIPYFSAIGNSDRAILAQQRDTWLQHIEAGVDQSDQAYIDAAFIELQLARISHPSAFILVLQRRLCALRELSTQIQTEKLTKSPLYRTREYAPPTSATSKQGDVRLTLTLNAIALDGLKNLVKLVPILKNQSAEGGIELVTSPISMLSEMLLQFEALSLFKHWSPLPAPPESSVKFVPETAIGSVFPNTAKFAIIGSTDVGWRIKQHSLGNIVDFEVWLAKPTANPVSLEIQWGPGDPSGAIGLITTPKFITVCVCIEDGGTNKWHDISGGQISVQEVRDRIPGRRHRYKLNSSKIRGKKVSALKISMEGMLNGRNSTQQYLEVFDIVLNAANVDNQCFSVLDNLRQLETFILSSLSAAGLQSSLHIALIGICRSSGALEFSLELVRILMDIESETPRGTFPLNEKTKEVLDQFLGELKWAVTELGVKLEGKKIVGSSRGFDPTTSNSVVFLDDGHKAISAYDQESIVAAQQVLTEGVWFWEFVLKGQSNPLNDGISAMVGVAQFPIDLSADEGISNIWMVNCKNGRTLCNGVDNDETLAAIYSNDVITFTFDCKKRNLLIKINDADPGIVLSNIPLGVQPAVILSASDTSVVISNIHRVDLMIDSVMDSGVSDLDVSNRYAMVDDDNSITLRPSFTLLSVLSSLAKFYLPSLDGPSTSSLDTNNQSSGPVTPVKSADDGFERFTFSRSLGPRRMSNSYIGIPRQLKPPNPKPVALITISEPPSLSLEEPYVLQPTEGVLTKLHYLLTRTLDCTYKAPHNPTICLLSILRSNLSRLVEIHLAPEEVGLDPLGGGILGRIRKLLWGVILGGDGDLALKNGAADTLASGLSLLIPSCAQRLKLFLSIYKMPRMGPNGALSDVALRRFLQHIFNHFAKTETVLQVLSLFMDEPRARDSVATFLELLLGILARGKVQDVQEMGNCLGDIVLSKPDVVEQIFEMLNTLQQHLVNLTLESSANTPGELLLCQYTQSLMREARNNLNKVSPSLIEENPPLLITLLIPLLHGICLASDRLWVARNLLPALVLFCNALKLKLDNDEVLAAEEALWKLNLVGPPSVLALEPLGWRIVPAIFESDEETDSDYEVDPEGKVYTSITSSNSCAVVDVCVSRGRAAWEFLLEADSNSDECSLFGAACKPLFSRCYNSSPSLWMRRAYNGVMYCRGRQLPSSRTMSKIHPGDIVRCELDMDEGTLKFSVNGELQEGGFDGIEGEIYPCAGSYRAGVKIRLLKVEIMGGTVDGYGLSSNRPLTGSAAFPFGSKRTINWQSNMDTKSTRGTVITINKKTVDLRRMGKFPPSMLGPLDDEDIATRKDETEWVTAVADSALGPVGVHAVNFEVDMSLPHGEKGLGQWDLKTESIKNLMIFGVTRCANPPTHLALGTFKGSAGWRCDGVLYLNGQSYPESQYGVSLLPLSQHDTVTVELNLTVGVLSFCINGTRIGPAFGPESSGATIVTEEFLGNFLWFPAGSLSHEKQTMEIMAGGTIGTRIWPLAMDLQYVAASLGGRLSATMIAGSPQGESEISLGPWLQAPLLSRGLREVSDPSDLVPSAQDEGSWSSAWGDEIGGKLLRERASTEWYDACKNGSWKNSVSSDSFQSDNAGYRFEKDTLFVTLLRSNVLYDIELFPSSEVYMQLTLSSVDDIALLAQKTSPIVSASSLDWTEGGTQDGFKADFPLPQTTCTLEFALISSTPDDEDIVIGKAGLILPLSDEFPSLLTFTLDDGSLMEFQFNFSMDKSKKLKSLNDDELWRFRGENFLEDLVSGGDFYIRAADWLGETNPDPPVIRKVLEKTGSYSFPHVEGPFLGALLLHTGLLEDLSSALDSCSQIGKIPPTPSPELARIWGKVRQLRVHLRSQKQAFMAQSADSSIESDNADILFEGYMKRMTGRCQFLLDLKPYLPVPEGSSLVGNEPKILNLPKPPSLPGQMGISRWRSEEFATSRSRKSDFSTKRLLTRQITAPASTKSNSIALIALAGLDALTDSAVEETDDLEIELDVAEADTVAMTVIQSVAAYVLTGGEAATPLALRAALVERSKRAESREFGLTAVSALLDALTDSNIGLGAVTEALLFIRPAFQGLKKEGGSVLPRGKYHCTSGLEGVSVGHVRDAFKGTYTRIITLLSASFEKVRPVLSHLLMTCIALDYSTDEQDLEFLKSSGILLVLQKMASLSVVNRANELDVPAPETSYLHHWSPWSPESVRNGLITGSLLHRDLARHISRLPPSSVPAEVLLGTKLARSGVNGDAVEMISAEEIITNFPIDGLLAAYGVILESYLIQAEKRALAAGLESEKRQLEADTLCQKRVADLLNRGVPLLDNGSTLKAKGVVISELCTVATIPAVDNVGGVFATGIVYSFDAGPLTTGNYFEVTVLNPGEKASIGVGLANSQLFPTNKMPGWTEHSYGYHGDDGQKFGVNKTPGRWATWNIGDVIGCGIDFERQAIWYTRNGTLLGDAFTNVFNEPLTPVIGFHSNGESIQINFGLAPFAYLGPEVIMNRSVVDARVDLKKELKLEMEHISSAYKNEMDTSDDQIDTSITKLALSPSNLEPTLSLMRNGAWALINYLLASTSDHQSISDDSSEDKFRVKTYSKFQTDILKLFLGELYIGTPCLENAAAIRDQTRPKDKNGGTYKEACSNEESPNFTLENGEAEPHMHRIFQLLASIRHSRPPALQTSDAISIFLRLLSCGSPRIQRLLLLIFEEILPQLDPIFVDMYLPNIWQGEGENANSKNPFLGNFISVLFGAIEHAHSPVSFSGEIFSNLNFERILKPNSDICFGIGQLVLNLSDQCIVLLSALHKAGNWREHISRRLLLPLRSVVAGLSIGLKDGTSGVPEGSQPGGVAALAIIGGSMGAVYPGVRVCNIKTGEHGTVLHFQPGTTRVTVTYAGSALESTDDTHISDLESEGKGICDPDTAAQPVTLHLVALTRSLLDRWNSRYRHNTVKFPMETRLLSLSLAALGKVGAARPDLVVAACVEEERHRGLIVVKSLATLLLEAGIQGSKLPCIMSSYGLQRRWRSLQLRLLSAQCIGPPYTCLEPLERKVPPPHIVNTGCIIEKLKGERPEGYRANHKRNGSDIDIDALWSIVHEDIVNDDDQLEEKNECKEKIIDEHLTATDLDVTAELLCSNSINAELSHILDFSVESLEKRFDLSLQIQEQLGVPINMATAAIEATASEEAAMALLRQWKMSASGFSAHTIVPDRVSEERPTGHKSPALKVIQSLIGDSLMVLSNRGGSPGSNPTSGDESEQTSSIARAVDSTAESSLLSEENNSSNIDTDMPTRMLSEYVCLYESEPLHLIMLPRKPLKKRSDKDDTVTVTTLLVDKYDWLAPGHVLKLTGGTDVTISVHNGKSSFAYTEEPIVVDILDHDTGLCLPRRVPIDEVRASDLLFGVSLRNSDCGKEVVNSIMEDTEDALISLRSRAIAVRLAGGEENNGNVEDLLWLLRLLAAQEMKTTKINSCNPSTGFGLLSPLALKWATESYPGQVPPPSLGVEAAELGNLSGSIHGDSPLDMLLRKLFLPPIVSPSFANYVDYPVGDNEKNMRAELLGKLLTQELLDSFRDLCEPATPYISGNISDSVLKENNHKIVHESMHPLIAPLNYGGRIPLPKGAATCLVKIDARSAMREGKGAQLQFFTSEIDMRTGVNPLRVMKGFNKVRATKATASGLEFFKVEDADSLIAPLEPATIPGLAASFMQNREACLASTAFRSFMFTGIEELYFRVDAPAGSDQSPVRFVLSNEVPGSHGNWDVSIVGEATAVLELPSDENDFLSLNNLFCEDELEQTFFEQPSIPVLPVDEEPIQPPHLVPQGVAFFRGKWAYEVSVEFPPETSNNIYASIGWEWGPPKTTADVLHLLQYFHCGGEYDEKYRIQTGDVITVFIDINLGQTRFAVNENWVLSLDIENPETITNVRPFIVPYSTAVRLVLNFGQEPLKYSSLFETEESLKGTELVVNWVDSGASGLQSDTEGMKPKSKALDTEEEKDNWGFRFEVKPLFGIEYQVVRDMELICKLGAPSSDPLLNTAGGGDIHDENEPPAAQIISIWRPKAPEGYYSIGDIAHLGESPPPGGLVVKGDPLEATVSKPIKFRQIYRNKEMGITIWRPIPRNGQIALGDLAFGKKFSKPSMACSIRCVASWAVEQCPLFRRVWREIRTQSTQSIWSVQNGLGTFFGSQTGTRLGYKEVITPISFIESPESEAKTRSVGAGKKNRGKKPALFKLPGDESDPEEDPSGGIDEERMKLRLGAGTGYALLGVRASTVMNIWFSEGDITGAPGRVSQPRRSIVWATWLLTFLLSQPSLRHLVVRDDIFSALVSFLHSPGTVQKHGILPLITALVQHRKDFLPPGPDLSLLNELLSEGLSVFDRYAETTRQTLANSTLLFSPLAVRVPPPLLRLSDLALAIATAHNDEENLNIDNQQEERISLPHFGTRQGESDEIDIKVGQKLVASEGGKVGRKKLNIKSRAFDHLIEIKTILKVFCKGWESSKSPVVLNSLLCEAWSDTFRTGRVIESSHPLGEKDECGELVFPGATSISVFIDPRCSLAPESYCRLKGGKPENDSVTILGKNAASSLPRPVTIRGNTLLYECMRSSQSTNSDEWGFAFMAIAAGPVWEETRRESNHPLIEPKEEKEGEVNMIGARQLEVQFDLNCALPKGFTLVIEDGKKKDVFRLSSPEDFSISRSIEGCVLRYRLEGPDTSSPVIPPQIEISIISQSRSRVMTSSSERENRPRAFSLSELPQSNPQLDPGLHVARAASLYQVHPGNNIHRPFRTNATTPPMEIDSSFHSSVMSATSTTDIDTDPPHPNERNLPFSAMFQSEGSQMESSRGSNTVCATPADCDVSTEAATVEAVIGEEPPWGWGFLVRGIGLTRMRKLQLGLLGAGLDIDGRAVEGSVDRGEGDMSNSTGVLSLDDSRRAMIKWTTAMDKSLTECLGEVGKSAAKEGEGEASAANSASAILTPWSIQLTTQDASYKHVQLASMPTSAICLRTALLLRLNDRIACSLPFLDLSSNDPDSLGYQIRQANYLILPHVKSRVLEGVIQATKGKPRESISITLDNMRAASSREKGEFDPSTCQCLFVQGFRQLANRDPALLRTSRENDRVFQVNFTGEDGVDAGGVFREAMTRMTDDLFSDHFDLLCPCPNARHVTGLNTEKYVPSPRHRSGPALAQFEFMGRLMGISLRSQLALPFELPSLIWKRLIGLEAGMEDLRAIDNITCQFLEALRSCDEDGIDCDNAFNEHYSDKLTFTYTGSDGVERPLMPGGKEKVVTFANRHVFSNLVEKSRLHEFDVQVAAIARGLSDIVPLSALRLFTWKQLEVAISGDPTFDMDWWEDHTDYSCYDPDSVTIKLFWKVLGSLTPQEKSGFVRFAWGRSRLPSKAQWTTDMKISNRGASVLPVSHTCFFSVELPEYTTEDDMRKGLLTAIHFGACGILNA